MIKLTQRNQRVRMRGDSFFSRILGSGSSPVSWCDDHERDKSEIYRVRDHPIMSLDEDQNIFLVTSVIQSFVETKKFIRKHAIKLTMITFKDECEWNRCFSQQYANHCLRYVFSLVAYQVSRNFVLAPRSVMITISLHFNSQSDCSILSEVTRKRNLWVNMYTHIWKMYRYWIKYHVNTY